MPRKKTRTLTQGQKMLSELLSHGMTQAAICFAFKIAGGTLSQPSVHFWSTGVCRPVAFQRAMLNRLLGIPTEAWLTPEELSLVESIESVCVSLTNAPPLADACAEWERDIQEMMDATEPMEPEPTAPEEHDPRDRCSPETDLLGWGHKSSKWSLN